MSALEKAKLQAISSDEAASDLGPEIAVQFNPTTLRLQLNASLPSNTPAGTEVRQSNGSCSATLTLDLIFDTADEGTTSQPVSVREKTALVEKFVVATPGAANQEKPPKLRFIWGDFQFDGVMSSLSIDFDHFASDGTPLRAKMALSIQEQNSKYMFLSAGPGSRDQGSAPRPGQAGLGAIGSAGLGFSAGLGIGIGAGIGIGGGIGIGIGGGLGIGIGASAGASIGGSFGFGAQVGVALDGEALPEFAARVGMEPGAWRALAGDVTGGFSLEAGAEIGFDAGITANAGLGVSLGVEAGLSASLEGSFGLDAKAGPTATPGVGTNAALASGLALSAGGGVSAALNTVQNAKVQEAVRTTKQEFAMAVAPAPPPRPAPPPQSRSPLAIGGLPTLSQQKAAPAAPPPPRVDVREASFGFGVPLVPARGDAAMTRAGSVTGSVAVREKVGDGLPPKTLDPATPAWEALPLRPSGNSAGAKRQKTSCGCRRACRCGCGGH